MALRYLPCLLAGVVLASSPVIADESSTQCKCLHDTAIRISGASYGSSKLLCLYVLNLWSPTLKYFQRRDIDEEELVTSITGYKYWLLDEEEEEKEKISISSSIFASSAIKQHPNARFFMKSKSHTFDERISSEGTLLLRAYVDGKPYPLSDIEDLNVKISVGDNDIDVIGGNAKISSGAYTVDKPLEELLQGIKPGTYVKASIVAPKVYETRYSWYRPKNGIALDTQIISGCIGWNRWNIRAGTKVETVPASLRIQYRWYQEYPDYKYLGIGVGPQYNGASTLTGISTYATFEWRGFEIGAGVSWNWMEGNSHPILLLNITNYLKDALGLKSTYPGSLVEKYAN